VIRISIWLVIIFGVIIQTTIISFIQVGNARPDLLLIITVSLALIFGRVAGGSIGFFSGLLWDLLTAQVFGMYTLAKLLTGYIFGTFEKKVFKENPILPIVAFFLATFVHEFILYISAFMLGIHVPFWEMVVHTMLPNAIYNSVVGPFVYFCVYRLRYILWSDERQMTDF
jgi:rod shape-determining protein MreD